MPSQVICYLDLFDQASFGVHVYVFLGIVLGDEDGVDVHVDLGLFTGQELVDGVDVGFSCASNGSGMLCRIRL